MIDITEGQEGRLSPNSYLPFNQFASFKLTVLQKVFNSGRGQKIIISIQFRTARSEVVDKGLSAA